MNTIPNKVESGSQIFGRWIELGRPSKSIRLSVDLTQTKLSYAMDQYVSQYPLPPIYIDCGDEMIRVKPDPYTNLCRSHYEADSQDMKGGIRYPEVIIDLDYDSGKDLTENFQAAADAAKKLTTLFDQNHISYHVYFSGSKGFHITFLGLTFWPINEGARRLEYVPQGNLILRRMVRMICNEAGVPESTRGKKGNAGWDPSLYDLRRMVRIPGVRHGKSLVVSQEVLGRTANIYKTWLPLEWTTWTMPQVVEWSTTGHQVPPWDKMSRSPWLESLWVNATIANDKDAEETPVVYKPSQMKSLVPSDPHTMADLKGYPPCITSIRQGAITTMGLRNRIGIAVCSFHASSGESITDAITTMQSVPSRSRNVASETQSQWNAITVKGGHAPKDNYHFSNRSCRTLRGCGASCTDQCPLYNQFAQGELEYSKKIPYRQAHNWGSVKSVTLGDI